MLSNDEQKAKENDDARTKLYRQRQVDRILHDHVQQNHLWASEGHMLNDITSQICQLIEAECQMAVKQENMRLERSAELAGNAMREWDKQRKDNAQCGQVIGAAQYAQTSVDNRIGAAKDQMPDAIAATHKDNTDPASRYSLYANILADCGVRKLTSGLFRAIDIIVQQVQKNGY